MSYYDESTASRSELFTWLKEQGAVKVVVPFQGGGDSGGVEGGIELIDANGKIIKTLDEVYPEYDHSTRKYKKPLSDEHRMILALCKPVYDKYGSFAGEFYVNGQVTYDVKAGTVKIDGQEEVSQYEPFEEEL